MRTDIDTAILRELQQNAKTSVGQIAKRTGIPATTVHNHIKKLEREGIITSYVPVLNHKRLGLGIFALIFMTVENKLPGSKPVDQEELARLTLRIQGVERARILTGGYDLVLEVRVPDVDALNSLLIKELRKVPGVDKTHTMLVLEEIEKKQT